MTLKIAVVHNLPLGGAWRRLSNQLPHLNGNVVEICLSTATPLTDSALRIPLRRYSASLPRATRPPARYLDLYALYRAWDKAAERLRSVGADVVFLNPCQFLQAPPILGKGIPPVVYFCDEPRRVDVTDDGSASRNRFTRPIYEPLYIFERSLDRRTVAGVDAIATNSRYTASLIANVYDRTSAVIKMGVAESLSQAESNLARDDFVLSVGTLIPTKGHDLAILAASLCKPRRPVHLVAARPAIDEEKRLTQLAERAGVELRVEIQISDAKLAQLYETAFATVYLAKREPLGLASLEAQAHGCPVIVADEGGLPETILEGESGWSCPRSPEAVARLLDQLTDPGLYARVSRTARMHGATWTWNESAIALESMLREVARS